jgi:hypothetical protein
MDRRMSDTELMHSPWRWLLLCLLSQSAFAVDLEIRYGVLERLLSEQLFTAEGRKYVQGSKDQKCRYAFLEKPKLTAAGDRLQLTVNFSGQTALSMLGRCVGLGDSFALTLTAKPVVRTGQIGFDQFVVSTDRDSFYIRRVRAELVKTLDQNMRIDVVAYARKLIEAPQQVGAFQQEIRDLKMTNVRVAPDAIVLAVDFRVIVK